eukprot:TRINITY_DN18956_c0_g1_i1.p1 TRINITY_DN18956_c0_g1~~TRINITY_DN18956_c0_g1_i1.p1  ORF type:complete len:495 (-),score=96.53 TRINITY_DN18956_c0_g1_i1:9-1424(-)
MYQEQTAAESAVARKMVRRLMPFLSFMYVLAFLDRSNLGNAHTVMLKDTGITEDQYAIGVSLFFVTYIICEIPSNILLKMTTGPIWFSRIMVTWGIISICMMFVKDFTGLIFARLFLGAAEAGFLPGVVYYLTLWFTPTERAFAIGIFISAVPFSGMISGLLAYGILQMDGLGNLKGWQWLFLLEGIPTVLVGLLSYWVLPDSPASANWLTPVEKIIAVERLNVKKEDLAETLQASHFKAVLTDIRVWLCSFIYLSICTSAYTISFFLPSLIEQFGFSSIVSNLLTSPIHLCAFLALLLNGLHSDRTKERYLHLLIPGFVTLVGWGVASYTLLHSEKTGELPTALLVVQYISIMLASAATNMSFPVILTWTTEYLPAGSYELSLASAVLVGVGNIGGVLGPQVITICRDLAPEGEGYGWAATALALTGFLSAVFSTGVWLITKKRYHDIKEEIPLFISEQETTETTSTYYT